MHLSPLSRSDKRMITMHRSPLSRSDKRRITRRKLNTIGLVHILQLLTRPCFAEHAWVAGASEAGWARDSRALPRRALGHRKRTSRPTVHHSLTGPALRSTPASRAPRRRAGRGTRGHLHAALLDIGRKRRGRHASPVVFPLHFYGPGA